MSTRAEILEQLKAAGISYAVVEFSGEGDSGSIDSARLISRTKQNVTHDVTNTHSDLKAALTQLCEKELDDTGIDWYNNGGGFGEYLIDMDSNKFEFTVYTRYVEESRDHFEKGSVEDWAANKTSDNDEEPEEE